MIQDFMHPRIDTRRREDDSLTPTLRRELGGQSKVAVVSARRVTAEALPLGQQLVEPPDAATRHRQHTGARVLVLRLLMREGDVQRAISCRAPNVARKQGRARRATRKEAEVVASRCMLYRCGRRQVSPPL